MLDITSDGTVLTVYMTIELDHAVNKTGLYRAEVNKLLNMYEQKSV